jgi:catechol 2,3-dioxygenase-like lactoylglutathione lyase family enzyme
MKAQEWTFASRRDFGRSRPRVFLAVALVFCVINLHSQTAISNAPLTNTNQVMKQFAFFFRQSRQLSEAEQKQRSAEVVAWVKQQIAEGRKLEPRVLATENELVVSEENKSSASTNSGGTLVAINFLEAKDFEEAVKIAKTHPGLRYGVSIEVRPWTNPLVATDAPQSSDSHGMKPRISLLTIGVDDLEKSLRFYRDGLGLPTEGIVGTEFEIGAVAFFDLHSNLKLAIWPRKSLSKDTGLPLNKPSATEFSIGHNVASKAEVDAVMQRAKSAGATIVKPAQNTFWGGYAGYFQDPDGHLWEVAWNPQMPVPD